MIVRYFTIAGGNKTALVWDCVTASQHKTALLLLQDAEQVGFVTEGETPSLRMMGNELCINALLAFGYTRKDNQGEFIAESESAYITYEKKAAQTSIELQLPYTQADAVIFFNTIGYICTPTAGQHDKSFFKAEAASHNLPAFGVVTYDQNGSIVPVIYVAATDSLVAESACGSGSIAVSIVTGLRAIQQPTGELIHVTKKGNQFTISATVKECQ